MKRTLIIEFPWPPKGLSPNARLTRYAKASLFKKAKTQAYLLTRAAAIKAHARVTLAEGSTLNIKLTCQPPILRYRDEDNLIANCKAILDGIAEGMQVNDNTFHFKEQDWLQAENPGHLIINITWEPSLGCRSLGGRDHE